MPRGVYDRSKVKRKTKTAKSPKIQKVAKIKTSRKSSANLTETLQNISVSTDILSKLNTYAPGLQKTKDALTSLILSFTDELPVSMIATMTAPEMVSKPVKNPVSYPAPTPVAGVKLKKDGTPKARPGPKPKAVEEQAVAADPTPSNGNSDVFNPEHAS